MSERAGRGGAWTDERGTSEEGRRRTSASRERANQHGGAWTDERGTSEEGRRRTNALRERARRQGPVAILIGPPGAGKSTIGALLAARLGVGFTDTDADVEAAAGKTVSDIFIEDGEPVFRQLERIAVGRALDTHDGVVAVGGGAVLDPQTQEQLAGRPVIYLETGFASAAKRVGLSQARPLLIGNPRATLKALLDQRLPIYERLAAVKVTTDDRDPAQIADEIANHLAAS